MDRVPRGIRRLRDLASLARALFVVAFGLDVLSLLGFQQARLLRLVDGVSSPIGYTSAEVLLAVASSCALVLALWQAAANVRSEAPPGSILRRLHFAMLLPWSAAGRELLPEIWRRSASHGETAPPITVRLLSPLWSLWAPAAVCFGAYANMARVEFGAVAYFAAGIALTHAALSACAVVGLGTLATAQQSLLPSFDPRALRQPGAAAPPGSPPPDQIAVRREPLAGTAQSGGAAPNASPGCAGCGRVLRGPRCSECGVAAVAGRYRILEVLGAASDRRTYLASDPQGRRVTLKEIALATARDAYMLEAFEREARLLRQLRHPRIPTFVDSFAVGEGPGLRFYVAHRFVEGVPLEQEIEQRLYTEAEVLDTVEEILRTLGHLQSLSPPVFHRDVKPANLIRRGDGTLMLVDFGAARERTATLRSATMVGSVGYMPPEQLAGQVDRTSDPYAAGATALRMLTHRQPWEFMDGPELRLPRLPLSAGAQRFLARLLAASRQKRFADAEDALRALHRLRKGSLRTRIAAAAAIAVLGGLAIGLYAFVRDRWSW
jgi:hypothetical protein